VAREKACKFNNIMEKELTAAEICAQYIYDQDVQLMDYSDHVESGKNPKNHILWSAAEVLGLIESEGFVSEYELWDAKDSEIKRKRGTW
jgi:hypothetical protein